MKKVFIVAVLSLFLLLPLSFSGCKKEQNLSKYIIDCTYDEASQTLSGTESVDWLNSSDNMLTQVKFHLYPNAFRQNAKAKVVSSLNEKRAYYNGYSYGSITINDVKKTSQVSGFSIDGEDENILTVELNQGLYPDERVKIEISFQVKLPNINHRFGYGQNTVNFGNFYPIACVYEDGKGFVQDLYHSNGDPFYSECSDYCVDITYPAEFVLASSGEKLSTQEVQGKLKTSLKANKVRDFAFVLSKKFEQKSLSVDGITLNYFYYDQENADEVLQTAAKAIKTFDKLFGKYPYSQVSIVKANFVHGGMEYPNMVLVSDQIGDLQDLQYVTVHELAHQWWYGVVGNNEYVGAWQDEGLTEFSTLLFYQNNQEYGQNYDDMIEALNMTYKRFVEVYSKFDKNFDTSMNRRLDQYNTEPEYTNLTYTKGVLLFDDLRQSIGDQKFFKCLKDYYKKFSFKNASNEDLIESFIESSRVDLEGYFASWLEGNVVIM